MLFHADIFHMCSTFSLTDKWARPRFSAIWNLDYEFSSNLWLQLQTPIAWKVFLTMGDIGQLAWSAAKSGILVYEKVGNQI